MRPSPGLGGRIEPAVTTVAVADLSVSKLVYVSRFACASFAFQGGIRGSPTRCLTPWAPRSAYPQRRRARPRRRRVSASSTTRARRAARRARRRAGEAESAPSRSAAFRSALHRSRSGARAPPGARARAGCCRSIGPTLRSRARCPAPAALGWHHPRMYTTPFPANAHLTHHLHCDSRSGAGLGGD